MSGEVRFVSAWDKINADNAKFLFRMNASFLNSLISILSFEKFWLFLEKLIINIFLLSNIMKIIRILIFIHKKRKKYKKPATV
jgi:hypothetical protein